MSVCVSVFVYVGGGTDTDLTHPYIYFWIRSLELRYTAIHISIPNAAQDCR